MKLTYDPDRDDAYVEFVSDWKGTGGGSNMALLPMDGPELEAHFFVTLDNSLQAIRVRHASQWFSAEVLAAAEPFEPWDGVDRPPHACLVRRLDRTLRSLAGLAALATSWPPPPDSPRPGGHS